MTTLAQACKAIVTDAIDHDYIADAPCRWLAAVYQSEYGSYNGVSPKACKDYLQGLPSVCTVPFWNCWQHKASSERAKLLRIN